MCQDCDNNCPFQIGYTEGSSYQGHFTKDYVVFGNEIEDFYFNKGSINLSENNSQEAFLGSNSTHPEESTINKNSVDQAAIEKVINRRQVYMPFGCTVKETKLFFFQEADGILGLGVHTNNFKLPPNIIDTFAKSKERAFNAFSICYASEGGMFTVGGYNTTHHDPSDSIKYVPFSAESGQYRVHLNQIELFKFEGMDLDLSPKALNNGQGAFFDSGTTLLYAPSYTVRAIKEALNHHCASSSENCGGNRQKGSCWLYNPDDYPDINDFYRTFGSFSFYFGEQGAQKYDWKPEDYLYQETYGSRWFCLGLEVFEDRTILGGTFMKNHDILFDKRSKRIGFVRANCTIDIPEYIVTNKPTDGTVFDNLLATLAIVIVAVVIYGLITLNRRLQNSNSALPQNLETPPPREEMKLNFQNEQAVEMVEENSLPKIEENDETNNDDNEASNSSTNEKYKDP